MSKIKGFMTFLAVMCLSVLIVGGLYKYRDVKDKKLLESNEFATAVVEKPLPESFNALLVGTDKSGEMTDTIMLVNVNTDTEKIHMLSIPRDTKVKVDGKNRKINSCYHRGGLELLVTKVKELTNAPIHYYAIIGTGTLAQIVDALGGVEYEVERDMYYNDPVQDLHIDLEKGMQTLNGEQAEQYCRFRSYVMGDLTRTECQQKFLKALLKQKLKLKYVTKVYSLYEAVNENIETNVTMSDIVSNLSIMSMISDESQIECIETPGTYNDMKKDGISYYLIEDEYLDELQSICAKKFLADTVQ